ncbi:uncharacterized protein LOC113777222 [Coffea eugenioides]|uniref:uncharacterized protein LOC113758777 n=1 Tax=Coffea eugenioides TaxID=49369 RepID=UPI000F613D52|nr:uncharacterized protein LOC113758777 [Coffea eugenioides]XP_027178059.1 uncharacterized protein LOC113777222 [Coffea eugenioides]
MVNVATPNYSAMYEASLRAEVEIVRIKEVEKAKRPRPIDVMGNPDNPRQKGVFRLVKRAKVNTKGTFGSGKAVGRVARNNTPIALECAYYHRRHPGECRWKTGACFNCRQVGHRAKDCPKPPTDVTKGPKASDAKPKANARVHAMTDMEIEGIDDVVTGALSINSVPAYVLFDCGASHSFVSKRFMKLLHMVLEWLDDPYRVSTPGNKILVSHIRYKGCQIDVGGKEFDADLVQIGMNDFDVILDMDWLAKNFAQVDCRHKRVKFAIPREELVYQGNVRKDKNKPSKYLLTSVQAIRALRKGAKGYLAYVMDSTSEVLSLDKIPIVREFPDVFPEDLPGIPPD